MSFYVTIMLKLRQSILEVLKSEASEEKEKKNLLDKDALYKYPIFYWKGDFGWHVI